MNILKSQNQSFERIQKYEFDNFFNMFAFRIIALRIEFEMLLQFIGTLEGKRVLDLGCGIGRNGLRLAKYAEEVARQFKSGPFMAPLWLTSASGGKGFGSGIGF